jgi:hypothetical protein
LQRRQFAIGSEDVELVIVLPERRTEILEVENPVAVLVLAVGQHVDDRSSCSRSSVKSCFTRTAPPRYVMIAIRSAGVICRSR